MGNIIYKKSELDKAAAAFDKKGYAIFEKLLSEKDFIDAEQKINKELEKGGGAKELHNLHLKDSWFREFVLKEEFTSVAKSLLGVEKVKVFTSLILNKPPKGLMTVPWHQDAAYEWPIDPLDCATLWLAFDDVTIENGAMEFAIGAHNKGIFEMVDSEDLKEEKCLFPNKVKRSIPKHSLDNYKKTYLTIKKGNVSFHHSMLPHKSNPNKTENRRCAFSVRYCRGDIKIKKYEGMKREKEFKNFELIEA